MLHGLCLVPVLGLLGCGLEDPATETAQAESPWVTVEPKKADERMIKLGGLPVADVHSLADLHDRTEHTFIRMEANGMRRMLIMEMQHGSIPHHEQWGVDALYHFSELDSRLGDKAALKLTNLQLVGLLKKPQGVVYQIPLNANVKLDQLKTYPTRELDEFERTALKSLQEGQYALAHVTAERTRLLGALRITEDCRKCHQEAVGTLVGAFTYDLARDPRPFTPKPKPNPAAQHPNAPVLP
jgi:hypothetical protein